MGLCLCVIFVFTYVNCFAADRFNLLVMGDDSDIDTVPANSRVFKGVVSKLNNQMHDAGFDVYEEIAITDGGYFNPGERRSDRDLVAIARTIQKPPIDVAVLFSIYARLDDKSYGKKIVATVQGRLLHVKTGQFLGSFEIQSPKNWYAPANCKRECVLETVREKSQILAQDVGAVLATKLACLASDDCDPLAAKNQMVTGYELQFIGFEADVLLKIEKELMRLDGYSEHRPSTISPTETKLWYQSSTTSAKLNRHINQSLKRFKQQGNVRFTGNIFRIVKGKASNPVVLKEIKDTENW